MSLRLALNFWVSKASILKSSNDPNFEMQFQVANELSFHQPEKFMFDEALMRFLYDRIKDENTASRFSRVLQNLFKNASRRSLNRKNLMVAIRRLAVGGFKEESEECIRILLERNEPKSCLASNDFMEALSCIAAFDDSGAVTAMLDELERKEPEICEVSENFKTARSNNIEALVKSEETIDLVEIENEVARTQQVGAQGVGGNPGKLWAGPVG